MIEILDYFQSPFLLHTPGPWGTGTVKRGKLGDDLDKMPARKTITSGFRSIGKFENGPELLICEYPNPHHDGRPAFCADGGFNHSLTEEENDANIRLGLASLDLLRYAEYEHRLDQWVWVCNARHDRSDNPMSAVEFWKHTERWIPEIAALCPPLTPEQLAEYEAVGDDPETLAQARSNYYHVDDDGPFGYYLEMWRLELRRRALSVAYFQATALPGPAIAILLAVNGGMKSAPGRGEAIHILETLGLIVATPAPSPREGAYDLELTPGGEAYLETLEGTKQ